MKKYLGCKYEIFLKLLTKSKMKIWAEPQTFSKTRLQIFWTKSEIKIWAEPQASIFKNYVVII